MKLNLQLLLQLATLANAYTVGQVHILIKIELYTF